MSNSGSLEHLVGIFVGGKSQRMGGLAKGLLRPPEGGPTVVQRLVATVRQVMGDDAPCLLVGRRQEYASLQLPSLSDTPKGIGPIGGLSALLEEAHHRSIPRVITLACDLPFVSAVLLARLANAPAASSAVAPKHEHHWQPLFARYSVAPCRPIVAKMIGARQHSLQRIFDELGESALELPLQQAEWALLRDWDSPADF